MELMDSKLFKAAIVGDVNFLNETNNVVEHKGTNNSHSDYWLRHTSQNNNVIHIASAHNRSPHFVKEALRRFPSLVSQQNVEGNTCLHVAVAKSNVEIVEAILAVCDAKTQGQLWSSKNLDGDTPLHVALGKPRDVAWVKFVLGLAMMHLSSLPLLNKSNESPLHLYVRLYCLDVPQHEMQQKATEEQIRALIQANKACAWIKDKQGLTPLLQAAKNSCLLAVRIIVEECPESVEIHDTCGRTFLHLINNVSEFHYQEFKDLLGIDVISALKNREDNQGNTALHLAVQRHDIVAVRGLLECCVDLTIKSKEGVSAFDIIQSETTLLAKLMKAHAVGKQLMDIELITAIEKGDLTLLNERGVKYNDIYYLSQTLDGSNIIHLAIQKNQVEWAEKALQQFPQLIYQVNTQGENPLHIAAKFGNPTAALVARSVLNCNYKVMEGTFKVLLPINPVMVKNVRGNTPLHEVFCAGNYEFALDLINSAPEAALITNHNGETPLHLFAKFGAFNENQSTKETIISALVPANSSIASMRDNEGFTPALRAAQSRRLSVCLPIVTLSPESIELRDPKGRTVLHHFIHYDSFDEFVGNGPFDSLDIIWNNVPGLDTLRAAQDEDGNTPLHYALKEGDINMAQFLVDRCVKAQVRLELAMRDNQGNSVLKLLALHPNSSVHLAMKERIETSREVVMKNKLYEAVVKGDLANLLNQKHLNKQTKDDGDITETDFLSRTINGSSIVDLAIKHGHSICAKKALQHFPQLMIQVNSNGECPLHTAAKFDNDASKTVMECFVECYNNAPKTAFVTISPFQMRNSSGNTPLHEALRAGNFVIALSMLELNSSPASMTNHAGETPLHVFARYGSPYTHDIQKEIVRKLIKADNCVAYKRDEDGLNPLLRAAKSGRLWLCCIILSFCPQALELRDLRGKNILHHCLHFKSLVCDDIDNGLEVVTSLWDEVLGIDFLRVAQDMDGNTPLHYAIKEGDTPLACMLVERCVKAPTKQELFKVDNQGISILNLLASYPKSSVHMEMKDKLKKCMAPVGDSGWYDLVLDDGLSYSPNTRDNFLHQSVAGSNILHLAIVQNLPKIAEKALEHTPQLIAKADPNGDNPLHIAAKLNNSVAQQVVRFCKGCTSYRPWTMKNASGNTPLHEALRASNCNIALTLIDIFPDAASMTNNAGETPLHLFARYGIYTDAKEEEIVRKFCQIHWSILCMRDGDGVTPLIRSVQSGRLLISRSIMLAFPQSIEIRDFTGRTVLHHFRNFTSSVDVNGNGSTMTFVSIWKKFKGIGALRALQDVDGNTPLHYAIKEGDIPLACLLVDRCVEATNKMELSMLDNEGNSVLDLLASHPNSPVHMALKEKIEKCNDQKVKMNKDLYEKVVKCELEKHYVDIENNVYWGRDLSCLFKEDNVDLDGEAENDENSKIPFTFADSELLSRAADGSNILHLAIKHRSPLTALKIFMKRPQLVLEADANGDNPIHIAAKFRNSGGLKVLGSFFKCYNISNDKFETHPPFGMKNAIGNTPLHEALRASNSKVALRLIRLYSEAALMQNNAGETPLHLFARYGTYTYKERLDAFKKVLEVGLMVTSTRDYQGFTPLLRAVQSGRIQVALLIAETSPGSIEVCDFKGRTMLHHLRIYANEMVETSMRGGEISFSDFNDYGVDSLRAVQDIDGNTPLHYNLKNGNFATAKLLMERCASSDQRTELTILNHDGESILDLLRMQVAKLEKDGYGNAILQLAISKANVVFMNELITKDLSSDKMTEEVYRAAVDGNETILGKINKKIAARKSSKARYLSQTPDGSNIVHLALRHGRVKFVEQALDLFPELIFQRDYNSDTPTHVAARNYEARSSSKDISLAAEKVLDKAEDCRAKVFENSTRSWTPFVWDLKNSQGNTPLHEALRGGSLKSIPKLFELIKKSECCEISDVTPIANNDGETPLHVYARYATPSKSRYYRPGKVEKLNTEALDQLVKESFFVMDMRDKDGLTPLLRAAVSGNIDLARAIWKNNPQAMQLRDTKGRTFLHLMDFSKIMSKPHEIFDKVEIDALRAVQDDEGNTPLHLAIKSGKYKLAKILMLRSVRENDCRELYLANQQGEYIQTLLAQDDVPNEVINVYKKFDPTYISNYELRSSYGITRKQIKERADSLSVIAALLATITFAAAFAVPGGLNQDIGIPIFIRKVAFKAFMFLDALAMCGSMLVLYFLVWVMIGSKSESFLLIDMSIILLQGSFVATILAFAAGVFVTTHREIKWFAILVCVLCGALTPMLNRTCLSWLTGFLIKYCVPYVNRFLIKFFYIPFSKTTGSFENFLKCLKRGATNGVRNDHTS